MKFGVITDCQYADVDKSDRSPYRDNRMSLGKLSEAIELFNNKDLKFVIHLGDLIDQRADSYDKLLPIVAGSRHQFLHVLGNHDFDNGDRENQGAYDLQFVLKKLSMTNNYYKHEVDNWKFVILDTNEVGVIEGPKNSDNWLLGEKILKKAHQEGRINAIPMNGTISRQQFEWLRAELDDSTAKAQSVIIFAHHPIYPERREVMLENDKILALLKDYDNIKAFLNGHNHDGDYGVVYNVPCITFKGMVDTVENSYSIVEVKDNKLKITGFGREQSREVELR